MRNVIVKLFEKEEVLRIDGIKQREDVNNSYAIGESDV